MVIERESAERQWPRTSLILGTANLPVLMKRQSQHEPGSGSDALDAMFDRLQAKGAADRHQSVTSAKQDCIAESSRNFTAACLWPFGDIVQDEFAALEPIGMLIGARAQDGRWRSWLPILRWRKGGPSALTTVLASSSGRPCQRITDESM